jgi:tetratricopeptide (TPR) repeat protein
MLASLAIVLLLAQALPSDGDLREALRAMDLRDYATAALHFQAALRSDPRNPKILSSYGLCLAGAEKFSEAAAQFRAAARVEPQVAAHQYNLGLALFKGGTYDQAEKAFREVLRLEPRHPRARVQLANVLLGQARGGDTAKMRQAAESYRRVVPQNPKDGELRFNYAFTLARTGDEEGALREYREVVRLAPDFPQGHFFLGITSFQLGNWDEALASFTTAAERGQNDFDLHYFLGSTLLKKGDTEGARKHLDTAAGMNPEHPGVHFQLASVYRSIGDKDRAASEQLSFRDLTSKQEMKWRADALQRAADRAIQQGNLAQGVSALSQALEAKQDAVLARNLAFAYLQQGDREKAQKYLEQALTLAPHDAASYNYLGLLAAERGDFTLAAAHFDKAAQFDPKFTDAWFNAGVAASQLRRYDAAIERFNAALKQSNTPRIRQALAMALADAGRYAESQQQFDAAQKQHAAAGSTR